MATNSSEHLRLHLWEPSDQVLRTEFNQNWTKIDTAVNAAQETAEAAQNTADGAYCPSNKPFVCGTYTGNGSSQTITLGFQPSFVLVTGSAGHIDSMQSSVEKVGFFAPGHTYDTVTVTDTGFTVQRVSYHYPELNDGSQKYFYIAFR